MTGRSDDDLVTADRRPRVMVVETEALAAMDLAQMMEDAGADLVGTAATPDDAVALAAATNPDVTVIELGGGNGLSVANAIRRQCHTVALFIAGSTSLDIVERVHAFNGSTPLLKPLRDGELSRAIRHAFQEATPRNGGQPHNGGESGG